MTQKSGFDRIGRTRFAPLGYARFGRDWRIVAVDEPDRPAAVGPCYASKGELLADLARYARENWGLTA